MAKLLSLEQMKQPLMAAGITTAVSALFFGVNGNVSVAGFEMPALAALFATAYVSSYAGELVHDNVLPHISKNQKLAQIESTLVSPMASGAAVVALLMSTNMLGSGQNDALRAFAVGAGSNLAAQFVNERVLSKDTGILA